MAQEGAQKLMLALELMLQAIPQYALPEILDNGDIIIRRKRPGQSPTTPETPPANDAPDKTRT